MNVSSGHSGGILVIHENMKNPFVSIEIPSNEFLKNIFTKYLYDFAVICLSIKPKSPEIQRNSHIFKAGNPKFFNKCILPH